MSTVEEIEAAIQQLPQTDLERLIHWLQSFDASLWDKQIEQDAASGKLDFLFQEAE